jgi:hypothetical protein
VPWRPRHRDAIGVVVEMMRGVEEGAVFMGVAFRGSPVGRSQLRLPQSRDRALQGSTHYGYCVHGSHLLPMHHDHGNDRTPATRSAIGIKPVAVSLSNAPPTATPSSVMAPKHLLAIVTRLTRGREWRQSRNGPGRQIASVGKRAARCSLDERVEQTCLSSASE